MQDDSVLALAIVTSCSICHADMLQYTVGCDNVQRRWLARRCVHVKMAQQRGRTLSFPKRIVPSGDSYRPCMPA